MDLKAECNRRARSTANVKHRSSGGRNGTSMTRSSKVYVLGAGMSVGAGIPTMDGLTKVVLAEENMRGDASMLGRFCAFAFPVYGRLDTGMQADMDGSVFAGERFAMNVEQFMAAIDAFRVFSDVTGEWKSLPNSPERLFPL